MTIPAELKLREFRSIVARYHPSYLLQAEYDSLGEPKFHQLVAELQKQVN